MKQFFTKQGLSRHLSFKHIDPEKVRKGIFLGGREAIIEQKKQCRFYFVPFNFVFILFYFLPSVDLKITERVTCFLIEAPPFAELCESNDSAKPGSSTTLINQHQQYLGYLSYDKNNLIGKGTFKTAHLASLTWASPAPIAGLGARNSQSIIVALKRPYDDTHYDRNSRVVKRYNYADESRKVLMEGPGRDTNGLGRFTPEIRLRFHTQLCC